MKIGNVTLTVDGDILSMDDDRGVGTRMNREAAADLWPAIKRFAETGSLVPKHPPSRGCQSAELAAWWERRERKERSADQDDDGSVIWAGYKPFKALRKRVKRVEGNSCIDAEHRVGELEVKTASSKEILCNLLDRVVALEEAAKPTDVQMPVEEAVKAAIASSGLPEFTFPEHEMAPQTAWVLANEFGNVLSRFFGLQPKTPGAYEIAFFDSQAEAEGVHDAMGLRGTVRPQLVNRRTLEPVG